MARKPSLRDSTPAQSSDLSIEEALNRAYTHWNAGQADQAELFCQRVLAVWPGQSDACHLMGLMAHAFGNLDLALQHVRRACQAPRAPAPYFSNLAEMCRQKGLLEEGEQAGRRAVAISPDLIAGWNNLGIILQEQGKYAEALACLERVVGRQPDNPEAHNNLANTCRRLGRLDLAETHYAKALELHPNYAEAHSNLANLLNDLGQSERAAAEARTAIELNPRLADAYLNLGAVEMGRHRHGEALRWLEALLMFAPAHGGGLAARAMALKHLDRLDAALESARRAVAAVPDSADTHNALGQVLCALNRFDEAAACFEHAAARSGPAAERARLNHAVLLMETGRKAEALAACDALIEDHPHLSAAWSNRADLKTFTVGDSDIARMEALLKAEHLRSFDDRMSLHFALGKAYLDVGDDDGAFRHFDQGNRMKRSTLSFDIDATERWMAGFPDLFPASRPTADGGGGSASDLPVFVVGIPRSGTTLIEQILASHPEVHGAGELPTLQRLVDRLGAYPATVAGLSPAESTRLGEEYVARVAPLAQGRRHVIDKMPANFLHAGLIHLILPQARIIHCRRDPVDTCLSCYTKLFSSEQPFAYDQAELGRFHRANPTLMAHWRAVLPEDRFIEVDYEAVVADIDTQARRLVAFLGLPWDECCLRFHETQRAIRTASVNQVRQPLYTTSTGRWKRHARHLEPLLAALAVGTDAP